MHIGIDMVRIDDVRVALERFGEAYLRRVFTAGEIDYCRSRGAGLAGSLAARFAAKEAVAKALDAGEGPFDLREVEVVRSRSGHCALALHGAALRRARARGIGAWSVSLTHEGEYAAATVLGAPAARSARRSRERRQGT